MTWTTNHIKAAGRGQSVSRQVSQITASLYAYWLYLLSAVCGYTFGGCSANHAVATQLNFSPIMQVPDCICR